MKKKLILVTIVLVMALIMAVPVFADPPDNAAHASIASQLKGDVSELVPGHVAKAHQAAAADLKGGVSDLVPEHVRP